jgi:hypothetical protein
MTPAEQAAVTRAAERMAAWYAAHATECSRGKRVLRSGGRNMKRKKSTRPLDAPDLPIVELRERGVIDRAREARLTAEAYEMSVQLRDNHSTEG